MRAAHPGLVGRAAPAPRLQAPHEGRTDSCAAGALPAACTAACRRPATDQDATAAGHDGGPRAPIPTPLPSSAQGPTPSPPPSHPQPGPPQPGAAPAGAGARRARGAAHRVRRRQSGAAGSPRRAPGRGVRGLPDAVNPATRPARPVWPGVAPPGRTWRRAGQPRARLPPASAMRVLEISLRDVPQLCDRPHPPRTPLSATRAPSRHRPDLCARPGPLCATPARGPMAARCLSLALALALAAAAAAPTADAVRMRARAADPSVEGKYELLGQAPIAAAHQMQLPCGPDQFLLMGAAPPGAGGARTAARARRRGPSPARDSRRATRARCTPRPPHTRRAAPAPADPAPASRLAPCPSLPTPLPPPSPPRAPRVWPYRRRGPPDAAPPTQQPRRHQGPLGA
jgi:hypothetical protein